jgi:hypothetical protein
MYRGNMGPFRPSASASHLKFLRLRVNTPRRKQRVAFQPYVMSYQESRHLFQIGFTYILEPSNDVRNQEASIQAKVSG